MRCGNIENLLYPMHMAGEASHDDPLGGLADHRVQDRTDIPLGSDKAGYLSVGGIDQEQIHPFIAEPGEPSEIG